MSDSPGPAPLPATDLAIVEHALFQLSTAAGICEGDVVDRLAIGTAAACDGLTSSVAATIDHVSQEVRNAQLRARRLCASRDKRLEWHGEELDANNALLGEWERQLRVHVTHTFDLNATEASLMTAEQLLGEWNRLPASVMFGCGVENVPLATPLAGMSHVQQNVDEALSVVSHPRVLKRDEENVVTISCLDGFGDPVRSVRVEDVAVAMNAEASSWLVCIEGVEEGVVSLLVTPGTPHLATLCVCVDSAQFEASLLVRQPCVLLSYVNLRSINAFICILRSPGRI